MTTSELMLSYMLPREVTAGFTFVASEVAVRLPYGFSLRLTRFKLEVSMF